MLGFFLLCEMRFIIRCIGNKNKTLEYSVILDCDIDRDAKNDHDEIHKCFIVNITNRWLV